MYRDIKNSKQLYKGLGSIPINVRIKLNRDVIIEIQPYIPCTIVSKILYIKLNIENIASIISLPYQVISKFNTS